MCFPTIRVIWQLLLAEQSVGHDGLWGCGPVAGRSAGVLSTLKNLRPSWVFQEHR